MKIHEFQAKQLFAQYGIPVPRGMMARTVEETRAAAAKLLAEGAGAVVVKAQIHAGGLGKAGGVKAAKNVDAAAAAAVALLGKTLVTKPTGPAGKVARKLLIEEATEIARELYVSMVLDRSAAMPALVASAADGMEIEEVTKQNPEKILTVLVDPLLGLRDFQVRDLNRGLGLAGDLAKAGAEIFSRLYKLFMDLDCRLAEVNPLVVTTAGRLLALDAKLDFDDTALFRHPDLAALRDPDEEDPLEVEAIKSKLTYIRLDGNIGCLVNGAGLAMATMDMIQTVGLAPANFLDIGGTANQEAIGAAFRILLMDPQVKGVLINIFGGILRCDAIAQGMVGAARELSIQVPMVIRLEGANAEEGRRIIAESGLKFTVANDFQEVAEKLQAAMRKP